MFRKTILSFVFQRSKNYFKDRFFRNNLKNSFPALLFLLSGVLLFQNCNSKPENENDESVNQTISTDIDTTPVSSRKDKIAKEEAFLLLSDSDDTQEQPEEKVSVVYASEKDITPKESYSTEHNTDGDYFYLTEEGEIISYEIPPITEKFVHPSSLTREKILKMVAESQEEENQNPPVPTTEIPFPGTTEKIALQQTIPQAEEIVSKEYTESIKNDNNTQPQITESVISQSPQPEKKEIKANNIEEETPDKEIIRTEETAKEKNRITENNHSTSIVVINGIPVNPSEEFKEMKISDIKSVSIVKNTNLTSYSNHEDTSQTSAVNSQDQTRKTETLINIPATAEIIESGEKEVYANRSEKIADNKSDIIRLYNSLESKENADSALSEAISYNKQAEPLYIIDGTRIETPVLYSFILKKVNPSDIESISFIKGTSASSLYGNQAIEGVILINTKSGNALQKIIKSIEKKTSKKSERNQKQGYSVSLVKI